jgi:HSP20 family protein
MAEKRMTSLATTGYRDPFSILRQMTAELDRAFTEPFWPARHWPAFDSPQHGETIGWSPRVDVFEREGCMVTRVDLPGVKKDDVTVEVTDGHLALSGERRQEKDEQKDNVYRTEREYGSFYRAIPLPDGVKTEDVKATSADGVLEVSIPLPERPESKTRKIQIEDAKGGRESTTGSWVPGRR